jgi:hypothetical protein
VDGVSELRSFTTEKNLPCGEGSSALCHAINYAISREMLSRMEVKGCSGGAGFSLLVWLDVRATSVDMMPDGASQVKGTK